MTMLNYSKTKLKALDILVHIRYEYELILIITMKEDDQIDDIRYSTGK